MISRHLPSGFAQRNSKAIVLLNMLLDALVIFAVLFAAVHIRFEKWTESYSLLYLVAILLFFVIGSFHHVYRSWRGISLNQELKTLAVVWIWLTIGLLALGFALKISDDYSRLVVGLWLSGTFVILSVLRMALRMALRRFRAQGRNTRKVALVGSGPTADAARWIILKNPWLGLDLVREFTPDPDHPDSMLQDLLDAAQGSAFDQVWIAQDSGSREWCQTIVRHLADTTVSICLVPDVLGVTMLRGEFTVVAGLPMVRLFETPFSGINAPLKRAEDIILAGLFLAVAALPMAVIALLIRLTSPGPVIFKQRRYGIDGREFICWKFRTMTVCEDGAVARQATARDPRVTRLGRFLRKTSLDELPQFINVLQGRMSVVGPRPHPVALNEEFRGRIFGYMLRHAIKPGITGWAQVNGCRGETSLFSEMHKRVEHDLWYIQNWSLWLDLKIVGLTVIRAFWDPKAY